MRPTSRACWPGARTAPLSRRSTGGEIDPELFRANMTLEGLSQSAATGSIRVAGRSAGSKSRNHPAIERVIIVRMIIENNNGGGFAKDKRQTGSDTCYASRTTYRCFQPNAW